MSALECRGAIKHMSPYFYVHTYGSIHIASFSKWSGRYGSNAPSPSMNTFHTTATHPPCCKQAHGRLHERARAQERCII